jgi:hypothetical protein
MWETGWPGWNTGFELNFRQIEFHVLLALPRFIILDQKEAFWVD